MNVRQNFKVKQSQKKLIIGVYKSKIFDIFLLITTNKGEKHEEIDDELNHPSRADS